MRKPIYKLILPMLLFPLLLALLAGCSTAAPVAAPEEAPQTEEIDLASLPTNIDVQMVDALRERDDVVLIDVREDWEYAAGHIADSELIPLGQISSRLAEIPQDKTVIAYCRSGNRSGQATQILQQAGFTVHNMSGGMIAWEQANLAVER